MAKKAKEPAASISAETLKELMHLGDLLGRTCYDVITNKQITSQDRESAASVLRQWDAITNKLRDEQKGQK
jgi:hypothetical protein